MEELIQKKLGKKKHIQIDFFLKKLEFNIYNKSRTYKNLFMITIQMDNLVYKPPDSDNEQKLQNVQSPLKIKYHTHLIQIQSIQIFQYEVSNVTNTKEKQCLILSTDLYGMIQNPILKKHPFLIDFKWIIQMQHFHLYISDNHLSLIDLIQIISNHDSEIYQDIKQNDLNLLDKRIKPGLKNQMKKLYYDHYRDKDKEKQHKNCKHCIVRYKKSLINNNLIIGELQSNKTENSNFKLFDNLFPQKQYKLQQDYGLMIIFKTLKQYQEEKQDFIKLHVPQIIITRDMGFFNDTLSILCTQSQNNLGFPDDVNYVKYNLT